jgi:NAD(P)H-hydrate epimerase
MWILDSEQMRAADRHAIEQIGMPSLVLMENAGAEVARVIEEGVEDLEDFSVLVLCGKGSNGGDGMVVARRLAALGARPHVVLLAEPEELAGDARTQWEVLKKLGLPARACAPRDWAEEREALHECDLVVDAILGTGFTGRLEGFLAEVVEDVNGVDAPVVAVDVPTGLSGASARVEGPAIEATVTVTFAAPKVCHVFAPAHELCGDLVVAEIGIPAASLEQTKSDLVLMEDELVAEIIDELAERPEDTHKGSWGHVVVVGGAVGRSGAPAMAGLAALTAGCGLSTVAAPAACVASIAAHAPELMQLALPCDAAGELAERGLPADLLLGRADVLVVGPGLGTGPGALRLLWELLDLAEIPVVLDADAVNLIAEADELPEGSDERPLILTPHPGELARLARHVTDAEGITRWTQHERLPVLRQLADRLGATIVLKGFRTLVAAPGAEVLVNPTGGPGLATAGSGDVLAGFLGGLLAQGVPPSAAAVAAVFLHGRAGDLLEQARGQMALRATDLLGAWPAAVRSVTGAHDHEDDDRP